MRRGVNDRAPASGKRYIFDGWNGSAVVDRVGSVLGAYGWGTDLGSDVQSVGAGPSQRAGGVGGLLAAWLPSEAANGALTPVFYGYDGNGNVTGLVDAISGQVVAEYDDTPFGEMAVKAGAKVAEHNPYRFSTKPFEPELGLYYYGFRYYDPATGRWVSRDPIEEKGGINLYGAVTNDLVNRWDVLGRLWDSAVAVSILNNRIANNTCIGSHCRTPQPGEDVNDRDNFWPRHPSPGTSETAPDGTGEKYGMPNECTDCITSVTGLIARTYEIGKEPEVASQIRRQTKGHALARILISKGWKLVFYWNDQCEVRHDNPGRGDSQRYYAEMAKKRGVYRAMPRAVSIAGSMTNLSPWSGAGTSIGGADIGAVTFGFGVTTFESHTFMVAGGQLVEAHWEARTPGALFTKNPFVTRIESWKPKFQSAVMGAVLLPPDVAVPAGMIQDLNDFKAK